MSVLSRIALILTIIGGINWGFIGFFQYDLVAAIFGGQDALFARVVYGLVGIGALISIGTLFISNEDTQSETNRPNRVAPRHVSTEFGEEADFKNKPADSVKKKDDNQ